MCGRGIPGTVVMVLPSRFPSDRIAGDVATRAGPLHLIHGGAFVLLNAVCASSQLCTRCSCTPGWRGNGQRPSGGCHCRLLLGGVHHSHGWAGRSVQAPRRLGSRLLIRASRAQRPRRERPAGVLALDQSRVRVTRSRQDARAIRITAIPPSTATSGSTSTSVAPCRPIAVNASIAQACGVMWATLFIVEL